LPPALSVDFDLKLSALDVMGGSPDKYFLIFIEN
jgi:hypothetical protein